MEVKIDLNELRKKSLFVAIPCYGGMCSVNTTSSLNNLTGKMAQLGVNLRCHFLSNESLVTRARNYCVDEFLRSESSHMLFVDADIGFNPDDIITMLHMSNDESEFDILTLPYPKKVISWEKIVHAIKVGKSRGMDFDANPNLLENYVGDFVFNFPNEEKTFKLDEPVEVMEGGTGLMMMRRNVFKVMDEKYPELKYTPDHARTEHFSGDRKIMAYFDTVIDPESNRYLSEDYMFCQWARAAGLKVWMCPWVHTEHVGTYIFKGSFPAIASIGANATYDRQSQLKNRKQRRIEAKRNKKNAQKVAKISSKK